MLSSSPSMPADRILAELRRRASDAAAIAHVPYSGAPEGAALLLSDGAWVPGSRVESATFPLTIPALQAAYVSAISVGRHDIIAAALSRPAMLGEWGWLTTAAAPSEGALATAEVAMFSDEPLPSLGERLSLSVDASTPADDAEGVALARAAARRAHAPYSDYPVGCVLLYELASGGAALVAGVNVEHPDWTRGLCAERSALAAAVSLGPGTVRRGYLSCLRDPGGTPCGACRQLLVELMPDGPLALDRGAESPERRTPRELLPQSFRADWLRR